MTRNETRAQADRRATQRSALSRLFSAAVFRELATRGRSALFSRLIVDAGLDRICDPEATVGDVFDAAFDRLKIAGQRDEYVYRAAISHKILMGTHSLRTASMLTEFRAGTSKADLVILNGTATVYEIKSERDSLARLKNQIDDYRNIFAAVNVIASETHVDGVLATVPEDVGVMCLSRTHRIQKKRAATENPGRISPLAVLDSLRAAEAVAILEALGVPVPEVANTQRHAMLRGLFAELDPATLHIEMVKTLKRTRNLAPLGDFLDGLPESLQPAALAIRIRRGDHTRMVEAVRTPLRTAMAWS